MGASISKASEEPGDEGKQEAATRERTGEAPRTAGSFGFGEKLRLEESVGALGQKRDVFGDKMWM